MRIMLIKVNSGSKSETTGDEHYDKQFILKLICFIWAKKEERI